MMKHFPTCVCLALCVAGCAGRAPNPVAVVNPSDSMMTCYQIQAEISANNLKIQDLARQHGWKVAQNVAAGVGGLVLWPLWFGMDWQGTAGIEGRALQERQQYLAGLAAQKHCKNPIRPN
jgi:hypothetical protein